MTDLLQSGAITEMADAANVSYILNDKSLFALTEFKVLKSQDKSFIKCAKVLYNGKIKLLYFTANHKSLKNMLPSLDGDTFLSIIANLINNVINIKNNGFLSCPNLDLSFDKVYIDQNTLEVTLIYLPVNHSNSDTLAFENELKTEIIKLISGIPAFSSEKMSRVCGYLSNGTLSLNQIYTNICSELKDGFRRATDKSEKKGEQKRLEQPPLRFSSVNASVDIQFNITKAEFVIGKNASQVDGAITFNKAVSRVHCKITYQNGTYYITDLGSANGTFVNKVRVASHHPQTIKSGDVIRLANSDFTVEI